MGIRFRLFPEPGGESCSDILATADSEWVWRERLQAVVADPTCPSCLDLTPAVTIETRNTIEVALHNWADSLEQADILFSLEDEFGITADDTEFTVDVWSPRAGISVLLKVEDASDPTKSVETAAAVTTRTMANARNFFILKKN